MWQWQEPEQDHGNEKVESDERYVSDPVIIAMRHGNLQGLKAALCLESNSSTDSVQWHRRFLEAVGPSSTHTEMVRILLSHCTTNIRLVAEIPLVSTSLMTTPLGKACLLENYDLVRLLLEHYYKNKTDLQENRQREEGCLGSSLQLDRIVDYSWGDRRTPLIHMAKRGNLPLVRLLVEQGGADILRYDQQAMNPLMHACTENHHHVVKYLLDHYASCNPSVKARVDYVNHYKVDTAIWYASAHGHADIVTLLIDRGAKIEYRLDGTVYSSTPLMEACQWGHLDVVRVLLEHGADPSNKTGDKALKMAKSAGYQQVVDLMTRWARKLRALEEFAIGSDSNATTRLTPSPPSLLPMIFTMAAKRYDLVFRIVCQRGDMIGYSYGTKENDLEN